MLKFIFLNFLPDAQGNCNQSVLHSALAKEVVAAATPVEAPEMANAGSELTLEQTAYETPQNPYSSFETLVD